MTITRVTGESRVDSAESKNGPLLGVHQRGVEDEEEEEAPGVDPPGVDPGEAADPLLRHSRHLRLIMIVCSYFCLHYFLEYRI